MPVTFAQPDPVSPQISAAYGSTEQLSHDLPAIASVYQRDAAMQQAAAEHAQALQAQINMQGQSLGERRLELQQHGMDQAAQFATSRLPSERDAFQAQAEMATQNNRAANAAWLNQQQLSQQEEMDLRRRQDAVGQIRQQMETGQLDEESGNSAITRLKTGIDRDKMRQERATAAKMEQQKKQMMDQSAFMAAVTNEDAAVRAKAIESRIVKRRNPYTDEDEEYFIGHDGDLKKVPYEKADKGGAEVRQQALEDKRKQLETKATADAETAYHKAVVEASKELEKRKLQKNPNGELMDPHLSGSGASDLKYQEDTLNGLINRYTGNEPDRERFIDRALARHRKTAGGGGAGGANVVTPGGGGGTPPPKTEAEQKFVAENKPFDLKTLEGATAGQKESVQNWNAASKAAERHTQDPQQLAGYRQSAAWAVRALSTYGSVAAMPPKVKEQYQAIKQAMALLVEESAAAPAQSQQRPSFLGMGTDTFRTTRPR